MKPVECRAWEAMSKGVSALECWTGGWVGRSAAGQKKIGTLHYIVANWHVEVIYTTPACKIQLYIGHNWVILYKHYISANFLLQNFTI